MQRCDHGDCRYLPLELLNDDISCLDKADVFALGATVLELATARALPSGKHLPRGCLCGLAELA